MDRVASSILREMAGSVSSRVDRNASGECATFEMAEPDRLTLKTLMRVVEIAKTGGMRVSVSNRAKHVCFHVHAPGDAFFREIESATLAVETQRSSVVSRHVRFRLRDDTVTVDEGVDIVCLRLMKQFPTDKPESLVVALDERDESVVVVRASMLIGSIVPSAAFAQLARGTHILDIEFCTTKPKDKDWVLTLVVRVKRTTSAAGSKRRLGAAAVADATAAASPAKKLRERYESASASASESDGAFGDAED